MTAMRQVCLAMPNNEALQLLGTGGTFYDGEQFTVKEAVIRPGDEAVVTLERLETSMVSVPLVQQLCLFGADVVNDVARAQA